MSAAMNGPADHWRAALRYLYVTGRRMPFSFRSRKDAVLWLSLWTAGTACIWWLIPMGRPLPAGSYYGFLSDGRTIATRSRRFWPNSEVEDGVHLWNIEMEEIGARPISTQGGQVVGLLVCENRDLLKVLHAKTRHVSLLDVATGKEVASFPPELSPAKAGDFSDFLRYWTLSPDGKTTAFATFGESEPRVEWYDVDSGRFRHRVPGCRGPILFSPDSQRLAVVGASSLSILDVSTGREISRLQPPPRPRNTTFWPEPSNGVPAPQEFSRDGRFLVDSHGNVWDLAAGARRFGISAVGGRSVTFTPDSGGLVALGVSGSHCWLAYYDLANGSEQAERRISLTTRLDPRFYPTWQLKPKGQWLLASGSRIARRRTALEQWLAKFTGYKELGQDEMSSEFVLVSRQTGREILRVGGRAAECSSDGRYVVVWPDAGGARLWDIPPRKPLRWFFLGLLAWSVPIASLARWRHRRRWRRSKLQADATSQATS